MSNEKGQYKTWAEIAENSVLFPAKESYAPVKTWIQSNCHNKSKCGDAGKWESTTKAVDSSLARQAEKLKRGK